jgi:hypothetical protein
MIKKIYRGEPGGVVKVIEFGLKAQTTPSGKSRPLLTRANCVAIRLSETVRALLAAVSPCTSPTGLGWGYGGSGPADLALSILSDVLRERPSEKRLYYGRFKAQPTTRPSTVSLLWRVGTSAVVSGSTRRSSSIGCVSAVWRCSHVRRVHLRRWSRLGPVRSLRNRLVEIHRQRWLGEC